MSAIPDSHRDLLSAQVGTLGTIGPDGRPQVKFAGEADLAPSIYLGAGLIKATIEAQVVSAPGAVQKNSGLVVPGSH